MEFSTATQTAEIFSLQPLVCDHRVDVQRVNLRVRDGTTSRNCALTPKRLTTTLASAMAVSRVTSIRANSSAFIRAIIRRSCAA